MFKETNFTGEPEAQEEYYLSSSGKLLKVHYLEIGQSKQAQEEDLQNIFDEILREGGDSTGDITGSTCSISSGVCNVLPKRQEVVFSVITELGGYAFSNFYDFCKCIPFLVRSVTNNQVKAYHAGATYVQAKCHDWTAAQAFAVKLGLTVEQAVGHNWTWNKLSALKAGATIEQAMSHDWTFSQASAVKAGVDVELAMGHDWTWFQVLAARAGVNAELAMSHDWTYEQVKVLEAGATIEQAINNYWTRDKVINFKDCMKQEDKTSSECVNEIFPESVEVAADALGQDALQVDGQQ